MPSHASRLLAVQGIYDSTRYDQQSSNAAVYGGLLLKHDPGKDLADHKEENHIQPNKISKLPWWSVHGPPVRCQHAGCDQEEKQPVRARRGMDCHSHEGVAARLKKSSNHEHHNRSKSIHMSRPLRLLRGHGFPNSFAFSFHLSAG
jgi:hypothetical protein